MKRTATKKLGYTTREPAKCREAISDIDKKLIEAVGAMLEEWNRHRRKETLLRALETKRQDL